MNELKTPDSWDDDYRKLWYKLQDAQERLRLARKSKWISVKDRLPKEEHQKIDLLIAWFGEDYDLGTYRLDTNKWCFWSGAWKPFGNQKDVTHWAEINPPAPSDT